MKPKELEDYFLQSLDQPLNELEKGRLSHALESNPDVARDAVQYKKIREVLLNTKPATFGPFFAQKVINKLHNIRADVDSQISFFFKKYQLALLGIVMALLAVNSMLADRVDIPSLLGIEETVAAADDELDLFDLYSNLK